MPCFQLKIRGNSKTLPFCLLIILKPRHSRSWILYFWTSDGQKASLLSKLWLLSLFCCVRLVFERSKSFRIFLIALFHQRFPRSIEWSSDFDNQMIITSWFDSSIKLTLVGATSYLNAFGLISIKKWNLFYENFKYKNMKYPWIKTRKFVEYDIYDNHLLYTLKKWRNIGCYVFKGVPVVFRSNFENLGLFNRWR